MKKLLGLLLILGSLFMSSAPIADAYVSVKGYYRSNGTYVAPYVRSNPNGLKYDNYSYTPSQGLYNKTYGTRGTYWDTPTYVTDPNYYLGKSIYDLGNSYSSTYIAPTTPSCPTNSYYDGISSCTCSYGYVLSGGSCVSGNSQCWAQTGYNSSYDSTTKSCKCDYGYVIGSSGQCVYKTTTYSSTSGYSSNTSNCPLNSHTSTTDSTKCQCNSGYQVDTTKTSCVLITNTGNNKTCTNAYGVYSYWNGTTASNGSVNCSCQTGYNWNSQKTECVIDIGNPQSQQDNDMVGKRYFLTNNTCVGLSGVPYESCIGYAYNH